MKRWTPYYQAILLWENAVSMVPEFTWVKDLEIATRIHNDTEFPYLSQKMEPS